MSLKPRKSLFAAGAMMIKKYFRSLRSISFPAWSVPLVLLVLCVLAFGILINRLGLYWDDWAKLLSGRLWGMSSYWAYYAEDRPYSAWTHIVLTPLLGYNPLPWQIFDLGMRFLTAWGAWRLLAGLWPAAKRQAALAAMLLVVYPVFDQQAIAVTFHQQWMQYALFTFSLALSVQAERRRRFFWLLTLLALSFSAGQLLITEYFVGVELVRLPILWVLAGESEKTFGRRALKTLLRWLPYAALLAVYVIWRLFFIKLTGSDPYKATVLFSLFSHPFPALLDLGKMAFVDSFYVLVTSWAQALDIGLALAVPASTVFTWGVGFAAALISGLYLARMQGESESDQSNSRQWMLQVLLIGTVGVLGGCLEAWLTGRRVIDDVHANRYAMPAMLGASLIWLAAIERLGRGQRQKAVILSCLVGLAVIFQLRTLQDFSTIWKNQLDFYWQLSWRAPMIAPDTALLSENDLFPNQGMFSSSAALNLAYPQSQANYGKLDYWIYPMNPLFKNNGAVNHPLNVPLSTQFRTLIFGGQTPNSILVLYDPQRIDCLWVLRPDETQNPLLPQITRQMLPASNLGRILPDSPGANFPPTDMFGSQPAQGFCYLYQKAELARQLGQWPQLLTLAETARQQFGNQWERYKTPHEWLTFIEGYAQAGHWQDAGSLTYDVRNIRKGEYFPYICSTWQRMMGDTPDGSGKNEAYQAVAKELGCQKP